MSTLVFFSNLKYHLLMQLLQALCSWKNVPAALEANGTQFVALIQPMVQRLQALNHKWCGCLPPEEGSKVSTLMVRCWWLQKQLLIQPILMLVMLSKNFPLNLERSCSLLRRPPHG